MDFYPSVDSYSLCEKVVYLGDTKLSRRLIKQYKKLYTSLVKEMYKLNRTNDRSAKNDFENKLFDIVNEFPDIMYFYDYTNSFSSRHKGYLDHPKVNLLFHAYENKYLNFVYAVLSVEEFENMTIYDNKNFYQMYSLKANNIFSNILRS